MSNTCNSGYFFVCFRWHKTNISLETGSEFSTFSDLEKAVIAYELQNFFLLKNVDSKTVASANRSIKGGNLTKNLNTLTSNMHVNMVDSTKVEVQEQGHTKG